MGKRDYGFHTLAVHAGNSTDRETGAVKRPITMANSYALPDDPSDLNWSAAGANVYTRNGGANQQYLQDRLAALYGAEDCVVLASGVAALSGLFFAMLKTGDHVIFPTVSYIAVYRLFHDLLNTKFGIETTIVNTADVAAVRAAIRPNTRLIHVETPGNPTIDITDIRAVADIAHEYGILLSVDNTFASPYNQNPLKLGADFAVESLTKYINGHGDAMGGAILGNKDRLDIVRSQSQINLGGVISPFNAWLIMRGTATLPLRMRQHNESAQKVAASLQQQPGVRFVAYPGLADHPGHLVAKRQMAPGFGGVLSFGLKADHDTHNLFVKQLEVITSAVSLGHDASLIVFIGENDERQHLYPEAFHGGFFRLSVGLEDTEDILEDLRNALVQVGL